MAILGNINNGEVGVTVRNKLLVLIDLYNKLAISNPSYVLDRIDPAYIKSATPSGLFLKDDGTWASVSTPIPNLENVLLAGQSTGGNNILSPDGLSILSVQDGIVELAFSAPGQISGSFHSDSANSYIFWAQGNTIALFSGDLNNSIMRWTDGFESGNIVQSVNDTTYSHTTKNKFDAPIHDFGGLDIATGQIGFGDTHDGTLSIESTIDGYASKATDESGMLFNSGIYGATQSAYCNIQLINSDVESNIRITSFASDNGTGINRTAKLLLDGHIGTAELDTTDIINIGTTDANIINIGRSGGTVNILGSALYEYAANQYVLDKLITLNYNGAAASGIGAGFEIEENSIITGYFKTNAARTGYSLKGPANADVTHFVLSSTTARTKTFQDTNGTVAENVNNLSFFASTTSAQLAGNISDETGSGLLVFNNNPTLIDPIVGTQTPNNNTTKAASTAYVDAGLALKQNINTFIDISATSTVVGWVSFTTKTIFYTYITPTLILVNFYITGTSNATTASITISVNASASISSQYGYIVGQNNGANLGNGGRSQIAASTNQIVFSTSGAGAAWTSTGTKLVSGSFLIMI